MVKGLSEKSVRLEMPGGNPWNISNAQVTNHPSSETPKRLIDNLAIGRLDFPPQLNLIVVGPIIFRGDASNFPKDCGLS